MTAVPILTQLRRSLWESIDVWPNLANLFRTRYTYEDRREHRPIDELVPEYAELPAIAIVGADAPTEWTANQQQTLMFGHRVVWWTPDLAQLDGEAIWQELIRAWWRALVPGTVQTYWQRVGADMLLHTQPARFQMRADPDAPQTRWEMAVALQYEWNPRNAEQTF